MIAQAIEDKQRVLNDKQLLIKITENAKQRINLLLDISILTSQLNYLLLIQHDSK